MANKLKIKIRSQPNVYTDEQPRVYIDENPDVNFTEVQIHGKFYVCLMGNYTEDPEKILLAKEAKADQVRGSQPETKTSNSDSSLLEKVLLRAERELPPYRIYNR